MSSKAAARRTARRREAAARLQARVVAPVGAELRSFDPLARGRRGEGRRVTSLVVAGVAAQAVAAAVLTLLGSGSESRAMSLREERVVVRVVEPPPVEVAAAEPVAA